MRAKHVAVLDIRSSEMTAVVGEKGVNNTYIIKSKYSCGYEGFAEGELLDIGSFVSAVCDVVKSTLVSNSGIKCFYVGVPDEFIKLITVDKIISFNATKSINAADVQALTEMSIPADDEEWRTVRHSCLYYVLSDKRKVIDPVGAASDSLQGKFCFYKCRNSFIGCIMDAFKRFKEIVSVNLIPSCHAQSMYLIDPEKRNKSTAFFDLGFISSSYSVVYGDGLLFSEAFSVGIGHVAAYLMAELNIPYEVALTFLSTVNLNAKEKLTSTEECIYDGKTYAFSTMTLRDRIREGLDGICETVEECRKSCSGKINISGPLLISGEGIKVVRGAAEHISGRLETGVEVIAPNVPYYDKPQFSSLLSLLDMSLNDAKLK